jgi:spermidine/putrescine transport system ATP-binding protein
MAGGRIQLVDLTKTFGDVEAVRGLNLDIHAGEFFSLLGPSGCGKTTTLRLIAGFEQPTAGSIVLDGVDMVQTPPHKRGVNTVFQSYALFPHLKVADNVGFGLRFHNVSKEDAARRIQEALRLVRLEGYEERRPTHLSGGEQQRVALARALILNPSVLLLDEPLGALDAKLRKALQIELKSIQEEVGITFVYVTHDQEEALTMSDRMAVMSRGLVEQVGSPEDVYEAPATAYVADFIGASNMMQARGEGRTPDGRCKVLVGDFDLYASQGDIDARGDVAMVIRPERVVIGPFDEGAGENRIPGMVERVVYVGALIQLIVRLGPGQTIQAMVTNDGDHARLTQGTPVSVTLPPGSLRVLAVKGGAMPEPARREEPAPEGIGGPPSGF